MLVFLLIAIVLLGIYFLPSIVAFSRGHRERIPILVLNIFAGWTFIAWVVALVWSFTSNVEGSESNIEGSETSKWRIGR